MLDSRLVKQAIACLAAFFGVSPGEALSALANILGGIIGALGAALAVYLTLKGQRKDARRQQEDERQRTSSAINREVAEFSRLAIGHLEICEHMHSGTTMIPARDLPAIMKLPEPIIYAGNADNIGRLANAQPSLGSSRESTRWKASRGSRRRVSARCPSTNRTSPLLRKLGCISASSGGQFSCRDCLGPNRTSTLRYEQHWLRTSTKF